jgi:hypothetical protein
MGCKEEVTQRSRFDGLTGDLDPDKPMQVINSAEPLIYAAKAEIRAAIS